MREFKIRRRIKKRTRKGLGSILGPDLVFSILGWDSAAYSGGLGEILRSQGGVGEILRFQGGMGEILRSQGGFGEILRFQGGF